MNRLSSAVKVRANVRRHRGDARRCPLCASTFDVFKDDRGRADALCWRCGAHERHRAQKLFLDARPELLRQARSLLHFAPEWCLRQAIAKTPGLEYVTGDLDPTGVDLQLDITQLELGDGSFDAIICSHVLEHVPDDATAMRELRRVLAYDGWCLVMVPIALDREHTYEDWSITSPEAREKAFLQHDHVRLYAPDIAGRLRDAGFAVEVVDMDAELGPDDAARYRLNPSDLIFLCR